MNEIEEDLQENKERIIEEYRKQVNEAESRLSRAEDLVQFGYDSAQEVKTELRKLGYSIQHV
jgi:aryl carrier-like protein